MLQYNPNELVKEKAPKNVSKYPIEQTYILDYNNNNNNNKNNNYSCKMPELWNSSISSKKTIAIREINMIPEQYTLCFSLWWKVKLSNSTEHAGIVTYNKIISNEDKLEDVLSDVKRSIENSFSYYTSSVVKNAQFVYTYKNDRYIFHIISLSNAADVENYMFNFKIIDIDENETSTKGSASWNRLMNQPIDKTCDYNNTHYYDNVWNKLNLYFHASFVPYDNYQYIGAVKDIWYKPIIYQYTNASPIFKIWTTIDMINPLIILHEKFYVRLSFVLSSDDKYD